jgi:hypothetical protein
MKVRTRTQPAAVQMARSSAIGSFPVPPTLTARSKAT